MVPHANYRLAKHYGLDYGDVLKFADEMVHMREHPDHQEIARRIQDKLEPRDITAFVEAILNDNRQDLRL